MGMFQCRRCGDPCAYNSWTIEGLVRHTAECPAQGLPEKDWALPPLGAISPTLDWSELDKVEQAETSRLPADPSVVLPVVPPLSL